MKRLLSILLVLMMLLSLAPVTLAEEEAPATDGLSWIAGDADGDGTLTAADAAADLAGKSIEVKVNGVTVRFGDVSLSSIGLPGRASVDNLDAALILQTLVGKSDAAGGTASEGSIPLTITEQPKAWYLDTTVPGASYTLTVAVKGGAQPYSYQWHSVRNVGKRTIDAEIEGATGSSYAATTSRQNYYCVITDATGESVTSDQAYLAEKMTALTQPAGGEITPENGDVTLKFVPAGGQLPIAYQWYRDGFKLINSGTNSSFVATMPGEYYCVAKDACGVTVTSDTATVTKVEPLTITSQPQSGGLPSDGSGCRVTVEVTGGKEPIRYNWYRADGTMEVQTAVNYRILRKTGEYYVQVFDGDYRTVTTEHFYVTEPFEYVDYISRDYLTDADGNLHILQNEEGNAFLIAKVSGGKAPYTFEWYRWDSESYGTFVTSLLYHTWDYSYSSVMSSVKTWNDLDQYGANKAGEYICRITDSSGQVVESTVFTVHPKSVQMYTLQEDLDGYIDSGNYMTLTVTVAGGVEPYTYQWYMAQDWAMDKAWIEYEITKTGPYATTCGFRQLMYGDNENTNHLRYWCVITDSIGQKITTKSVTPHW